MCTESGISALTSFGDPVIRVSLTCTARSPLQCPTRVICRRVLEKKSAMESVRVEIARGERVYQGEATSGMGFRGEVHVRIASRLWGMGKLR